MNAVKFEIEHALNMPPNLHNVDFLTFAENGELEKLMAMYKWTGYTIMNDGVPAYIYVMLAYTDDKTGIVIGASNPPKRGLKEYYKICKKYFYQCVADLNIDSILACIEVGFDQAVKWAQVVGFKFVCNVPKGYESGIYELYRWQK